MLSDLRALQGQLGAQAGEKGAQAAPAAPLQPIPTVAGGPAPALGRASQAAPVLQRSDLDTMD